MKRSSCVTKGLLDKLKNMFKERRNEKKKPEGMDRVVCVLWGDWQGGGQFVLSL